MKCPAGRAPVPVPRLRGEPAWRRGAHPEGFSEPWRMGQAWVAGEPPGFAAGSVSMAWAPGALFAHALLPDEEVFSGSTADVQRLWTLGDVFEVFAWREGAEGYVELHVSPNGHQAHLRWTAADFQRVRAGEAVVEDFAGSARAFEAAAELWAGGGGWTARMRIPASVLPGGRPLEEGERLALSFSRYDAGRRGGGAVLSSTSPHAVPSFHRLEEWRPVFLAG